MSLDLVLQRVFKEQPRGSDCDAPFGDLDGWDSLTYMRLVLAIEAEFGVELGPEEIQAMTSVAGVKKVLSARGLPV